MRMAPRHSTGAFRPLTSIRRSIAARRDTNGARNRIASTPRCDLQGETRLVPRARSLTPVETNRGAIPSRRLPLQLRAAGLPRPLHHFAEQAPSQAAIAPGLAQVQA